MKSIDQIADLLLEDATGYDPKLIRVMSEMSEENIKLMYREAIIAMSYEFGLRNINVQWRPVETIIRAIKDKAREIVEYGEQLIVV